VLGGLAYCIGLSLMGACGSGPILERYVTGPEASLAIGWIWLFGSLPAALTLGALSLFTFRRFLAVDSAAARVAIFVLLGVCIAVLSAAIALSGMTFELLELVQ